MRDVKNIIIRELSNQRTVSLYKDQEERIEQLRKKYNLNIKLSKLVREGVDLILAQLEKQLEENKE